MIMKASTDAMYYEKLATHLISFCIAKQNAPLLYINMVPKYVICQRSSQIASCWGCFMFYNKIESAEFGKTIFLRFTKNVLFWRKWYEQIFYDRERLSEKQVLLSFIIFVSY